MARRRRFRCSPWRASAPPEPGRIAKTGAIFYTGRVTELLYHQDPTLLEFSARVVGQGANGLILDRTAFYPEAGGQMADRGILAGLPVVDVQVDDAGQVHHRLEGALPEIGAEVRGTVDRARRRMFMALHTGQHMLSRALIETARAETVSSRLGENACTIDLSVTRLEERDLAKAEELASQIIEDALPVKAFFPTPEELAALPLRRAPKVTENIRVVAIGDFDVSPCGGTHTRSTAEVGLIEVSGLERYKGMMRVSFSAGRRAREGLKAEAKVLRALGESFTCGSLDVPGAVDKLRRALAESGERQEKMSAELAVGMAERLVREAGAAEQVIAVVEAGDRELLRTLAGKLTAHGKVAFLAAPEPDGLAVLIARPSGSTLDAGAELRRIAQAAGGKGGGRPDRAEGKLPLGTDFAKLVRDA